MKKTNLELVDIFFNQIQQIDGMSIVENGNGASIIPPKTKYYYMPRIIIKNLVHLQSCLADYVSTIKLSNIKSAQINEKHNIDYFIGNLIKNLTNHDCNNFEEYVQMCTAAITDETFAKYDNKTEVGDLDDENKIIIKRSQEYYGAETPFVLKTMIKNKHIEYELPLIRYSIYTNNSGEKVARIYMIQRKKQYGESAMIESIDRSFSAINSGVKEERNVPPSMVIVLAMFIGLLQSEGISNIIIPDFMTRRYAHFQNIECEEQRDKIQYHATNIFLNLFLRIVQHFEGLNVNAFPGDVDSFMHIYMNERLKCNNKLLEQFYLFGYNVQTHNIQSKK